mgnify:CR=1 FL=1
MAIKIKIHPDNPQQRSIFEVVDALRNGQICLLPTDSQFSIACSYSNKRGLERIRQLRDLDKSHTFTLLIDSMNGIAKFANVSDQNFKLIKRLIPGPFTFILPATKEVPKLLLHPRRKTIGFRVSGYPICEQIIRELGEPLLAVSAKPGLDVGSPQKGIYRSDLFSSYEHGVDIMIDDDFSQNDEVLSDLQTSVIDLTNEPARIHRKGMDFEAVEEAFTIMNYDLDLEDTF